MAIFIICGYGIPEDIRKDENYLAYLHIAFNTLFVQAAGKDAAIIPCGGPTNCKPPFTGTEADALAAFLREQMMRDELRPLTLDWSIFPEAKSLSSLENLVFAKEIMESESLNGDVHVFCEKTRENRVTQFAEKIFVGSRVAIHAIDFDTSKNRYLDPAILGKKESVALIEGLLTLENPERLKEHHALFEKKFAFIRQRQSEGLSHVDAVTEWFKKEKEMIFDKE